MIGVEFVKDKVRGQLGVSDLHLRSAVQLSMN